MNKTIKAKLDRIFSEFVRLRDSNSQYYGSCISCGKLVFWREADCGHFVNRQHMSLRFNERNCNLQCRSCNRFDEGNNIGYAKGLIHKYGKGVIDSLFVIKHQRSNIEDFEAKVLIEHYKQKIKELHESKSKTIPLSK